MKEPMPSQLLEMSQEDVREWLRSDINDLIDMDYDHPTEKGGE